MPEIFGGRWKGLNQLIFALTTCGPTFFIGDCEEGTSRLVLGFPNLETQLFTCGLGWASTPLKCSITSKQKALRTRHSPGKTLRRETLGPDDVNNPQTSYATKGTRDGPIGKCIAKYLGSTVTLTCRYHHITEDDEAYTYYTLRWWRLRGESPGLYRLEIRSGPKRAWQLFSVG